MMMSPGFCSLLREFLETEIEHTSIVRAPDSYQLPSLALVPRWKILCNSEREILSNSLRFKMHRTENGICKTLD